MLEHGFAGTAASLAQRFAVEKAELIQADIETSGPATELGSVQGSWSSTTAT
jgi:hypothetical protein